MVVREHSTYEEAHKAGRRVAAHAQTTEGARNAVTAGVDSSGLEFSECLRANVRGERARISAASTILSL